MALRGREPRCKSNVVLSTLEKTHSRAILGFSVSLGTLATPDPHEI